MRRISEGYEDLSCVDGSMVVGGETFVLVLDFLCDFGAMPTSVSVVSSAAVAVGVSSETWRKFSNAKNIRGRVCTNS
jgi:hypothetical protein